MSNGRLHKKKSRLTSIEPLGGKITEAKSIACARGNDYEIPFAEISPKSAMKRHKPSKNPFEEKHDTRVKKRGQSLTPSPNHPVSKAKQSRDIAIRKGKRKRDGTYVYKDSEVLIESRGPRNIQVRGRMSRDAQFKVIHGSTCKNELGADTQHHIDKLERGMNKKFHQKLLGGGGMERERGR